MLPGAGPYVSELDSRGDLSDPVSWLHPQRRGCPEQTLVDACIDSGDLWGIAGKAGTRDSTVETSSFHNNQLNQDIIHVEPLAWAT